MQVTPLSIEHFELAASWLGRPEINRWLTSDWRGKDVTSTAIGIMLRNKRHRIFVVLEDGPPCGLVGLADMDQIDQVAMIWYLLGEPGLGGEGLITRAVADVSRLGFETMGLRNIYAWIMEDNEPSRKVLERAGFQVSGRLRSATVSDGRQVDRIYYDLTRDG